MEAASLALSKVSLQAPLNLSFTTFNRHKNTKSTNELHRNMSGIVSRPGSDFLKSKFFGALELQVGGFFC